MKKTRLMVALLVLALGISALAHEGREVGPV